MSVNGNLLRQLPFKGKSSIYVKGSLEELVHKQNTLMRRLLWFVGIIMVFLIGLSIAQVALLANLHSSGTMMARTTESTVGMRSDFQDIKTKTERYLQYLVGDLPEDQLKLSARKIVGIVDNVHRLSGKLAEVTPERIEAILRHTNEITQRVSETLSQVNIDQGRAIASHVGEIIGGLSPQLVSRWFTSVSDLSTHVSEISDQATRENLMQKISIALGTIQTIGSRVEQLHELTIKI